MEVEEKRKQRLQFLHELYRIAAVMKMPLYLCGQLEKNMALTEILQ
jgi:hypothetical protein